MWLHIPSMCCPCSPGPEASTSDYGSPSPDPELWLTSNGKPTQRRLSWRGWKMRPWIRRLSGTTCPPSTADRGVASWIALLAAARARTSALRGAEPAFAEPAPGSGRSSLGSFAKWDPTTCSWRTSRPSLFEGSTPYSGTWPASGSMRNGLCSVRPRSARHTFASDSSSSPDYPTPSATRYGSSQNGICSNKPSAGTPSLDTMAASGMLPTVERWPTPRASEYWPTPSLPNGGRSLPDGTSPTGVTPDGRKRQMDLQHAARLWPTPNTRDAASAARTTTPTGVMHSGTTLTDAIRCPSSHRGEATSGDGGTSWPSTQRSRLQLNAAFVDLLMGWPLGWSNVEPLGSSVFTCWVTESSLLLRRLRGASSPTDCEERSA